jgi:hypothetical protein
MIKDLAKAVQEQQEQRKARREQGAKDGGTREGQPPDPEPRPTPDSPNSDR